MAFFHYNNYDDFHSPAIPIKINISINMGLLLTYSDVDYRGMTVTIILEKIKPQIVAKYQTSNNKHNMYY